jgi:hypothetical protein
MILLLDELPETKSVGYMKTWNQTTMQIRQTMDQEGLLILLGFEVDLNLRDCHL